MPDDPAATRSDESPVHLGVAHGESAQKIERRVSVAPMWCGDSLRKMRGFPKGARAEGGHQLNRVQQGLDPNDWKPITSVGVGVREVRIHQDGEHRVLYVAKFPETIYVLGAFEKKSRQTTQSEIRLAADRLRSVINERRRQRR